MSYLTALGIALGCFAVLMVLVLGFCWAMDYLYDKHESLPIIACLIILLLIAAKAIQLSVH